MNEQQERKLNDVAQELALFQMNTLKRLGELNETISHAVAGVKATSEALKALEARVKILEDARKVQIELNKVQLEFNIRNLENTKEQSKFNKEIAKSSFWDFFKRK